MSWYFVFRKQNRRTYKPLGGRRPELMPSTWGRQVQYYLLQFRARNGDQHSIPCDQNLPDSHKIVTRFYSNIIPRQEMRLSFPPISTPVLSVEQCCVSHKHQLSYYQRLLQAARLLYVDTHTPGCPTRASQNWNRHFRQYAPLPPSPIPPVVLVWNLCWTSLVQLTI